MAWWNLPAYFTVQLIFATIHGSTILFGTIHRSHCTVDKLNIDGSAISNPSIAGAGGILRDHSGWWISNFSLHLGLATNNMVELAAVRQGLAMARNMSFKFI